MTIREATVKDVPAIVRLWEEFVKEHDETVIKNNPKIRPYLIKKRSASIIFEKFARKSIMSKNSAVHVAEVNGTPVGYSLIQVKTAIPVFRLEKIGYICDLFVKKEFRNRKISSRLMDEAMKWFKKKGIEQISLAVYKDNEFAHSIYKKWGFIDNQIEMRRKI